MLYEEVLYNWSPWLPMGVCLTTAFLVWGSPSGKRPKVPPKCPIAGYWEDKAIEVNRQLRDRDLEWRRRYEDLKKKYHDERNKKR